MALPDPQFGALAVDLFFVLSGFVLAHAYDDRMAAGLSAVSFFRLRVIRLFPLFLLGFALCVPFAVADVLRHRMAASALIDSLAFNTFLLPIWPIRTWVAPFVLNGPAWSLFFELWVANLGYGLLWRQLRGRTLAAVIVISGLVLLATDVHRGRIDDVGFLWWGFKSGFARVLFSFFAGVALARLHRQRKPRLQVPSWAMLIALAAVLVAPLPASLTTAYEALCVFMLFPAMVYWGAEAREARQSLGALLGDASYAIYVVHSPMIIGTRRLEERLHLQPGPVLALLFVLSATAFAVWLHRGFDIPVRRALSRRFTIGPRSPLLSAS